MTSTPKHRPRPLAFSCSAAKSCKIPIPLATALFAEPEQPVTGSIIIPDDSMIPTFKKNTAVKIEQVKNLSDIKPGGVYFYVCHSWRAFVRRFSSKPHEAYLRLSCDNMDKAKYPAHLLPISSIWAVFSVSPSE